MNSLFINARWWQTKDGEWRTWGKKTAAGAPQNSGVYVFRVADPDEFGRIVGKSDIVYVGQTGKQTLQKRLLSHCSVREEVPDAGGRLRRLEGKYKLELAWKLFGERESAKEEQDILKLYEEEHYELPPCNRNRTGEKQELATEKFVRTLSRVAQDERVPREDKLKIKQALLNLLEKLNEPGTDT